MATATRIYVVQDNQEGDVKLVRAATRAAAINHVVSDRFTAAPASPDDVARLMSKGLTTVETAGAPAVEPEATAGEETTQ